MKSTRSLILLLMLAATSMLICSCSALDRISDIQKPNLSISDVSVTNLSLRDIELTFDVEIENPNPVTITLNDYAYDFQLNSRSFVSGDQDVSTEIASSGSSIIKVPVQFGYQELLQTFTALRDQDETDYTFLIEAGVDVPFLGRTVVPFTKNGKLPIVKIPKIRLGSLKLRSLSLTKADLEVELYVENPNAFDLDISGLTYNLNLNEVSPISGELDNHISVARKSGSTVRIPIRLNILEMGSAVRDILLNKDSISYSFSGSSTVDASLPIFSKSSFNFDKEGTLDILR